MGYMVFTEVEQALEAARSLQDFAADQEKRAEAVGADHDDGWWRDVADAAGELVTALETRPDGEVR